MRRTLQCRLTDAFDLVVKNLQSGVDPIFAKQIKINRGSYERQTQFVQHIHASHIIIVKFSSRCGSVSKSFFVHNNVMAQ